MNVDGKVGFGRRDVGELDRLQESREFLIGMGIALVILGAVAM